MGDTQALAWMTSKAISPPATKDGKVLAMPFTMLKTLESMGDSPSVEQLLEAATSSQPQPLPIMRCMNPTCSNNCEITDGQGRPPRFCGAACRLQHNSARRRLTAEVNALTRGMDTLSKGSKLRRRLNSERAKRLFALERYPEAIDQSPGASGDES